MADAKVKLSELVSSMLMALQNKYLIADGLMISVQNEEIVRSMISGIDIDFDALMTECVMLADEEPLPGTNVTKKSVTTTKLEFDNRVRDWLAKVKSGSQSRSLARHDVEGGGSSSVSLLDAPTVMRRDACYDIPDDLRSRSSRRSSGSSRSQISFKCKESQVKVKVATLTNELEIKRSKYELESKMQMVKAEQELEMARKKFAQMQLDIERERRHKDREYELRVATLEAEAWQEVERNSREAYGDSAAVSPGFQVPSEENGDTYLKEPEVASARGYSRPAYSYDTPLLDRRVCVDYPSDSRRYGDLRGDGHLDSRPTSAFRKPENKTTKRTPAGYESNLSRQGYGYVGGPPVQSHVGDPGDRKPAYYGKAGPDEQSNGAVSGRPSFGVQERVDKPADQTHAHGEINDVGNRSCGVAVRNPVVSQDYPPPRPEIKCFDGDPLNYWSFVRSFDTHIAQRMSSDSAKLVYLLQHCTPKVRSNLEHFSRDADMGYRMARESLYNDYGQSYIIAHHCERKLLDFPKLKEKDPARLRTLNVLMDKCLAMLVDIQDFATLNSLGTIQKITEKLPEQMQRGWVKWSYQSFQYYGKQAKFPELVEFVRWESEEANSLYGKVFYSAKRPLQSSPPKTKRSAVFNAAAATEQEQTREKAVCLFCESKHQLAKCKEFLQISRRQRIDFLKQHRCCFRCLKVGHMINKCSETVGCTVDNCAARHHTVLHMFAAEDQQSSSNSAEPERVFSSTSKGCSIPRPASVPYFMTIPVKVRCGQKEVETYAMLDSGSQRTFCEKSIARKLNAKGPAEEIPLTTLTSGAEGSTVKGKVVTLVVSDLDGEESIEINNVLTIDKIPLEARPVPSSEDLERWSYMKDVPFRELEDKSVGLLIGLDAHKVFRPLDNRLGPDGAPDAVKTPLGWVLFGAATSNSLGDTFNSSCMHVTQREKVEAYLPPEEQVVSCGLDGENSREDRISYKQMKETVKLVDGHLELPLLLRSRTIRLPNNRAMAEKRLGSLGRRLAKNGELHQRYVTTMQSYLEKGYAEPLSGVSGNNEDVWYLPHQPVINPKKPEKLRVVFDCAARFMGTCLNDHLMNGPHLTNTLVGVLSRFRLERIALVSDIEAMFHQVRVETSDRDMLRFLWWPNGDLSQDPKPYRMTVHLFGASSSPSCASFCLRQAAVMFGNEYSTKTVHAVERNFYVDDCLVSCENPEEAIALIKEMTELLQRCGFKLTKWMSNHKDVNLAIPEKDQSPALASLPLDGCLSDRILGVHWDVGEDNFRIKTSQFCREATRRGILAMSHSIFDPLGFLAPVLIEPKLLLRELGDFGWDEAIPDEQLQRWESWASSLQCLESMKIARCFKPVGLVGKLTYELHSFADASKLAYGAVSYLRIQDEQQNIHCSFLMGKGHLAPTSVTTIPRLELLAAVCALRLNETLMKELELPISESYFWSDSTAVLQSIYNSRKRFPVFVANRLAEIERGSKISSWRYVPSQLNPADDVSRGVKTKLFVNSSTWLRGPQFLWEATGAWPEQLEKLSTLPDEFPMLERKATACTSLWLAEGTKSPMDHLIGYFSNFHRLKNAAAWWIRYLQYLRLKHAGNGSYVGLPQGELSVAELQVAELRVVKYVQKTHFPLLLKTLLAQKPLTDSTCSRSLQRLSPCIDDQVLRIGGRLCNAPVEYETRHPIVLPADSHLTRLVVNHYHAAVGHAGVRHTFCALAQRYWVETPSSVIRRVIDDCITCRRQGAKPCNQIMAELPPCRLQVGTSPFFHTGCDYLGPFKVKIGRSIVKRYICLFTCMTVRAVHLEVAHSMSTDSFIAALRRFVSRRGSVGHIYSDNGSNFVGAERELKESIRKWNQHAIGDYLHRREIDWHFNPPQASHFGGSWERLVRSVRRVLTSITQKAVFSDEELVTLVTEVEAVVNSRPLTPVTFVESVPRPLSPNDILLLCPDSNLPMAETESANAHSKHWKRIQLYADYFWRRWVKEYLPTLLPRSKWLKLKRNVSVNDIVLMIDEATPRSQWPLGRVVKTFPNSKGIVRTVSVRTRGVEQKRPISKICVFIPAKETQQQSHIPTWL